jgi:hypothetical protein
MGMQVFVPARAAISSFDHQQQYGLRAPIDALAILQELITDRDVVGASLDHTTGDLHFSFAGEVNLQVFTSLAMRFGTLSSSTARWNIPSQ